MKHTLDVDNVITHSEHAALIILSETGIEYTAQCGGMGCTHPKAEGFVISVSCDFAPDGCDYGCWNMTDESRLDFAKEFDGRNLRVGCEFFNDGCSLKFDYDRLSEMEEGWVPVIIDGVFDSYTKLTFTNQKAILHTGNCD